MAHRESIQCGILSGLLQQPFFWTVSSSVGYGCRNKTEDVLLVQFFLNKIIDEGNSIVTADIIAGTEPSKNPYSRIPKKLVPDGDFGGKTWGAIKWLQKKSGYCVVDGMVSHSNGTSALTPKQNMWYTIHMLNWYYSDCTSSYIHDIRQDPTLPPLLCGHLTGLPDLV
jgi:hypothetical protein